MVRVPPVLLPCVIILATAVSSGFRPTARVNTPVVSGFSRTASQSELVIHKEGTSEYHRPACPVVRDANGVIALTRAQAEARGLKPHTDCEKEPGADKALPTTGRSTPANRSPGSSSVFVYIDDTKYYHREKCVKSVGPVQRMALDTAGRTHWPCPACRPPVRKKSDAPAVPKRLVRG